MCSEGNHNWSQPGESRVLADMMKVLVMHFASLSLMRKVSVIVRLLFSLSLRNEALAIARGASRIKV